MAGTTSKKVEPTLVSAQEKNLNLQLKGPEFTYLTTVMTMYIDTAKGYVQATPVHSSSQLYFCTM